MAELFEETLVERSIRQDVDRLAADGRQHRSPITTRVPHQGGVPAKPGKAYPAANPLPDRLARDVRGALAPLPAPGDCLELEGGHPDDIGVLEEKPREHRHLFEVARVDGCVEDDREVQLPRPFDVLKAYRV